MSKTIKRSFNEKLIFENMYNAHIRASKTKRNKKEVILFEIDLENNLINLIDNITNNTYKLGKYREFTIYEPKQRVIKALPYKDRIVQQWYIYSFIKPYIIPRFINNTYACIDKRGTHKAIKDLQRMMRQMIIKNKDYYVLKCDVKKYFYNIDKKILFDIMKKYISDKKVLSLTHKFIYDNELEKGIPIGNYTSQYYANIYLNEMDKYIKYDLKIKYYVRYMDDFILLVANKEKAKLFKNKIELFLNNNLKLELNNKSRYYHNKNGINFCGYIVYHNYILVRKNSIKKIKKKIKKWNKKYELNELNFKECELSYNSWLGHISHSNSYNLKNKITKLFKF